MFALVFRLHHSIALKAGCCSNSSNRLLLFSAKYKLAGSLFVKVIVSLVSWSSKLSKSVVFWVITRRRVVIVYRRFRTTYRSHPHGSRFPEGKDRYVVPKRR
jgi:hypothetical protein